MVCLDAPTFSVFNVSSVQVAQDAGELQVWRRGRSKLPSQNLNFGRCWISLFATHESASNKSTGAEKINLQDLQAGWLESF